MPVLIITPLILVLLLVIIIAWVFSIYNNMVRLRARVKNAWSQIDVQLKRRYDLVPNLVETAKGYMKHERETLEAVIQARNQAVAAGDMQSQAQAENQLTATLGRLMAVVEQYPDLKANQNMMALQEELTSTENRIGFARQHYNDSVMVYNTKINQIPTVFVANLTGFDEEPYFEIEDPQAREVPKVAF